MQLAFLLMVVCVVLARPPYDHGSTDGIDDGSYDDDDYDYETDSTDDYGDGDDSTGCPEGTLVTIMPDSSETASTIHGSSNTDYGISYDVNDDNSSISDENDSDGDDDDYTERTLLTNMPANFNGRMTTPKIQTP